jgi:hypothetical protein
MLLVLTKRGFIISRFIILWLSISRLEQEGLESPTNTILISLGPVLTLVKIEAQVPITPKIFPAF